MMWLSARHEAYGPGHAEVGDRDEGRVREALGQAIRIGERQLRGDALALAPVRDEQRRALDQPRGQRRLLVAFEVEHDAALAAVDGGVESAAVGVGLIAVERAREANRIAAGRLDADHLGAELGEQLRAVGDRTPGRDLNDAQALERRRRCAALGRCVRSLSVRPAQAHRLPRA